MIRETLAKAFRRGAFMRGTIIDLVVLAAATGTLHLLLPLHSALSAIERVPVSLMQSVRMGMFGTERWLDAELPLWNPYLYGGFPFHATGWGGIFYPANRAYLEYDLLVALRFDLAVHALVASLGAYALARGLYVRRLPAVLVGVLAVYAWPSAALLGGATITAVRAFAWFPWIVLFVRRALVSGNPFWGLLLSLATAAQIFSGAVSFSAASIALAMAYAWFDGLRRYFVDWERLGPVIQKVLVASLGIVVGVALAGAQAVPSVEFLRHGWEASNWLAATPGEMITRAHTVVPNVPGVIPGGMTESTIAVCGVFAIVLAAFGLARAPGREKWVYAVLVFLGYAFMAGDWVGIDPKVYALPLFDPASTRLAAGAMAGLFLLLLAGAGADVLLSDRRSGESRVRLVWPLCAFLVGAVVWSLWQPGDAIPWAALGLAVVGLGIVLGRDGARITTGAWIIACLSLELAPAFSAVPRVESDAAIDVFGPDGEFDAFAIQHKGQGRMALVPATDDVADGYQRLAGVPNAERTVPLYARSMLGYLEAPWHSGLESIESLWTFDRFEIGRMREEIERVRTGVQLLQGMNVEYVVAPLPGPTLLNNMTKAGDLFASFETEHSVIYKVNDVLPIAYILHEVEVRSPERSWAEYVKDPDYDIRKTVLVEEDIDDDEFAPGGPEEGILVYRYEDAEVELELTVTSPGILVLTDNYFPGWTARFGNGTEREVFRVNEFMRGVRVQPGDERVTFVYETSAFDSGVAIARWALRVWVALAVGTVVVGIVMWVMRRRRGRSSASEIPG